MCNTNPFSAEAAPSMADTCQNKRTITLVELERRVLGGLKERLLAPELFAEFAEEYRAELCRIRAGFSDRRKMVEDKLKGTSQRIDRIVNAIAEGTSSQALKAKLTDLEAEKDRLETEQREFTGTSEVVDLHPNLPELYRRRVTDLESTLRHSPVERAAASQILRQLIEGIVVYPGERRGETQIELTGSITAILEMAGQASKEQTPTRSVGVVVPRGGGHHSHHNKYLPPGGTTKHPIASLCFLKAVSHRHPRQLSNPWCPHLGKTEAEKLGGNFSSVMARTPKDCGGFREIQSPQKWFRPLYIVPHFPIPPCGA